MLSQYDKSKTFAALHQRDGAFVVPNPWDVGSARLFAALGFEALASTSSGRAWAEGKVDGELGLEATLAHSRRLAQATDLPVSVDFEHAFADAPAAAGANLRRLAETGVAGGSIEDFTGDASHPVYDFDHAVERVQAGVEAVHGRDVPFTLTARAENLLHGVGDLDDTVKRLQAFEAAGADVLFAPGLRTLEQVRTVTAAVAKPVNVLAVMVQGASREALASAGAKRLSVGGSLAGVAYGAMLQSARELHDAGTFEWFARGTSSRAELGQLMHAATPH